MALAAGLAVAERSAVSAVGSSAEVVGAGGHAELAASACYLGAACCLSVVDSAVARTAGDLDTADPGGTANAAGIADAVGIVGVASVADDANTRHTAGAVAALGTLPGAADSGSAGIDGAAGAAGTVGVAAVASAGHAADDVVAALVWLRFQWHKQLRPLETNPVTADWSDQNQTASQSRRPAFLQTRQPAPYPAPAPNSHPLVHTRRRQCAPRRGHPC
mmetsp:Transcript_73278/g.138461  ORF Transcript_73278/g.138461 Transcript_73278/m.138461 type:complete len:219 (-) Transcript_73278:43-699(-)